jgi:hypothetical protein
MMDDECPLSFRDPTGKDTTDKDMTDNLPNLVDAAEIGFDSTVIQHESPGDDVSSDGTLSDASECHDSLVIDAATASCTSHCLKDDSSPLPSWTSFSLTSPQDKGDEIVVQPLCGYRVAVPCLNPGSSHSWWETFDDLDLRWYDRFSPSSDGRLQRIFSLWITVLERMTEIPLTSDNVLVGILVLRHTFLKCYSLAPILCATDSQDVQTVYHSSFDRCLEFEKRLQHLVKIPWSRQIISDVGY